MDVWAVRILNLEHDPRRRRSTRFPPPSRAPSVRPPVDPLPPILRLPVEVRHQIFRYLLPHRREDFRIFLDARARFSLAGQRPLKRRRHASSSPPEHFLQAHRRDGCACLSQSGRIHYPLALLLTSRQFYAEALAVLYSEHMFHFIGASSFLPVLEFLRQLSPEARDAVRKVRLSVSVEWQRQRQFELLCALIHDYLPGLTVFHADALVRMA